ncbi:MAG TPA: DUF3108 domain-containing protein [Bryobacteraceae bacterium]|jgi:hypothetical protein|nr:DUF3108 domain-containing protein [Bryobacteraceae bacterium]
MSFFSAGLRRTSCLALFAVFICAGGTANDVPHSEHFPLQQALTYRIEWHSVNAGTANLQFSHSSGDNWQVRLNVESAGLVSRLYHISDKYTVLGNDRFCPAAATLDAQEGGKHTITNLNFDSANRTVEYHEHDAIKNTDKRNKISTPDECTREISGALAALSQLDLAPGKTATFAVTNGKKAVNARIESQARESLTIDGTHYNTTRYEAFLFDNVLYRRHGRLFIWVADDVGRTPVQLRFEIGFPVGNVLLQLEKQQKF